MYIVYFQQTIEQEVICLIYLLNLILIEEYQMFLYHVIAPRQSNC